MANDSSYRGENLLDILRKAGYDVAWLDNDGGGKGVSDRVATVDRMRECNPKYKNGDTLFNKALLDGLEERIAKIEKDAVIVLHVMRSHGPSLIIYCISNKRSAVSMTFNASDIITELSVLAPTEYHCMNLHSLSSPPLGIKSGYV